MRKSLVSVSLLAATALAATACGSSSSGGTGAGAQASGNTVSQSDTNIGIGYFQSATIGPEVLIAGNSSLASKIAGKIKLTPIDSGVEGLAELRSGRAFDFVSGVGNPPVVGAISSNTNFKVIYAESFDAAQLIVGPDIKTNQDLAGKSIGDLEGSSEDFEIRGWLSKQGLSKSVKVIGFPSEAAVEAAFKAHRIDAGYVEIAQALDLEQHNQGRKVVTAQQIAALGFPSLNVLGVTDSFAAAHHAVVQQVVCQVMRAQALSVGPQAATYIGQASKLVGATPAQAVAATKIIPYVTAKKELSWFQSPGGTAADGEMFKAYTLTGAFLKAQGRVSTVPTAAQITSHLDSSYVVQAVKDHCDR